MFVIILHYLMKKLKKVKRDVIILLYIKFNNLE